jgi:hypothetical protein
MKDEYIRTHRREDSIEMKLRKIGFDRGYCIGIFWVLILVILNCQTVRF